MKKNNRKINRFFQIITVVLFVTFIVSLGIIFIFNISPGEKKYSEVEKRYLTEFPEFNIKNLSDGSFTDNITKYVSDNFIFREKFVELSTILEENRGIKIDGLVAYSSNAHNPLPEKECIDPPLVKVKKSVFGNETSKLGEIPSLTIDFEEIIENTNIYDELDEEDIKGQKVGALYVIKDTALEIFYGNSSFIQDYVNIINAYRLAIPQNINIYNLVIPTNFEFGLPKKFKSEIGTEQKPFIDKIYSSLNPSIISVDAYSNIEKHYKEGEYLYFRTDHHWTALGAYRAYEAFADQAGFIPTPLSNFEQRKVDRFLGTFYSSTFNKELYNNPDHIEFYAPLNNYTVTNYNSDGAVTTTNGTLVYNSVRGDSNGYLVFMGGDIPLSVIETDANTGRNLLVFKESYGNAFAPFLTENFDKLYIADIRTFPFNAINFINEHDVTDILFINSIMTSCSPPRIKNYLDLMQK